MKLQTLFISGVFSLLALTPFAEATPPARIMDRLDQDGDGVISADEFRMPRNPMIEHLDADGDGAITQEEINAAREERQKRHEQRAAEREVRMQEMFSRMDADGDGRITADEIRRQAFSRIDSNNDGVLSRDEFRAHRQGREGFRHRGGKHSRHGTRQEGGQ